MTDHNLKEAQKAVENAATELRIAQIAAAQAALAAEEANDAVRIYGRRYAAAQRILAIWTGEPTPPAVEPYAQPAPAPVAAQPAPASPTPAGPSVFEQAEAAKAAGDPLAARSAAGGREDADAPPPSNRYHGPPCPACGTPGGMKATMIQTKGGLLPGMSCSKCGHQKVFSG